MAECDADESSDGGGGKGERAEIGRRTMDRETRDMRWGSGGDSWAEGRRRTNETYCGSGRWLGDGATSEGRWNGGRWRRGRMQRAALR
eukprot:875325-Pyramimonas_sp.AAC.1